MHPEHHPVVRLREAQGARLEVFDARVDAVSLEHFLDEGVIAGAVFQRIGDDARPFQVRKPEPLLFGQRMGAVTSDPKRDGEQVLEPQAAALFPVTEHDAEVGFVAHYPLAAVAHAHFCQGGLEAAHTLPTPAYEHG